jgi:catechol 2,3-dioxygenase-like lactoylglutathione lyase family enzyme
MTSNRDVIFRTSDLQSATAFYNGILGFPIVPDTPDRVVGFDTGAFVIYFERGDPNGAVFEFDVCNVDGAKAQLLAQGCELIEEDPALPRCYMRDRFGLTFNLNKV